MRKQVATYGISNCEMAEMTPEERRTYMRENPPLTPALRSLFKFNHGILVDLWYKGADLW